jgi:hypothetical protein
LNNYFVPFVIAFVVFCFVFLGLDVAVMKAQGLSLLFSQ